MGSAARLALENSRLQAGAAHARLDELRASRARLVAAADAGAAHRAQPARWGTAATAPSGSWCSSLRNQAATTTSISTRCSHEVHAESQEGAGRAARARTRDPSGGPQRPRPGPAPSSWRAAPPSRRTSPTCRPTAPAASRTLPTSSPSEALANIIKHAQGTEADDRPHPFRRPVIEVADDGCGGADPGHGSGLRACRDRVGALDGPLDVHRRPAAGHPIRRRSSRRLILADDAALIREGLRRQLAGDGFDDPRRGRARQDLLAAVDAPTSPTPPWSTSGCRPPYTDEGMRRRGADPGPVPGRAVLVLSQYVAADLRPTTARRTTASASATCSRTGSPTPRRS